MEEREDTLQIAWTTVDGSTNAESFARTIIDSGLAACVQIDSPVRSVYIWEGKVESAVEARVWIKFPKENGEALYQLVRKLHPYDVPQWIVMQAAGVSKAYAQWIDDSTR